MIRRPPRSTLFPYTTLFRSGESCLTLPERVSWVGTMPLRVAPLRTVLLVGLDETNVELARGLRGLGLRVLLAQRSEEHTSELQSRQYLVCRLLLEKKNK